MSRRPKAEPSAESVASARSRQTSQDAEEYVAETLQTGKLLMRALRARTGRALTKLGPKEFDDVLRRFGRLARPLAPSVTTELALRKRGEDIAATLTPDEIVECLLGMFPELALERQLEVIQQLTQLHNEARAA